MYVFGPCRCLGSVATSSTETGRKLLGPAGARAAERTRPIPTKARNEAIAGPVGTRGNRPANLSAPSHAARSEFRLRPDTAIVLRVPGRPGGPSVAADEDAVVSRLAHARCDPAPLKSAERKRPISTKARNEAVVNSLFAPPPRAARREGTSWHSRSRGRENPSAPSHVPRCNFCLRTRRP